MATRTTKRTSHRSLSRGQAFGLVLRQLRQRLSISQDEFAHRSGYHRTFIGMLERGERAPSLDTLFDVAETLGMKPSELVAEVERAHRRTATKHST